MNHQPFETWLLLDESLSPEQTHNLEEHLQGCEQCRELQDAWAGVTTLFHDVPAPVVAPGFVDRWEVRLRQDRLEERHKRQIWQSWITLVMIANVSSFLAVALGWQFFTTYNSLTDLLLFWVYRVTSLLTFVNITQNLLATLIRILPGLLPAGGWAALVGILSVGTLLWVLFIARIAKIPWRQES